MPGVNLTTYVHIRDSYGVRVGEWADQIVPGEFICKVCLPRKPLSLARGKKSLLQHASNAKHRIAFLQSQENKSSNNRQLTLPQTVAAKETDEKKEKAKDLEIALCLSLARHSIPPNFVDCLIDVLKTHIIDSEIVQNVQMGRTKASYLIEYGLGPHFAEETNKMLSSCNAFSLALDESEVKKETELEIMVHVAGDNGTVNIRHFTCIDLPNTEAETITEAALDSLRSENINFHDKMIAVSTDGCPTMLGSRTGVIKRIQEQVEQCHNTGSCNCHHLCNTMKYACEAFNNDVKMACVNIWYDLGGAESYGLKRARQFKDSCKMIGFDPKPFKRFVDTRFRTIRNCIEPILFNYNAIIHYYSNVKKPSSRQKLLIEFFVDRRDMSALKLKFVYSATKDLTLAVDYFESRDINVNDAGDKVESILVNQMRTILEDKVFNNLDGEEVTKKSRKELVSIDVTEAPKLTRKRIFIGTDCVQFIKKLGLTPDSKQLDWFMMSVKKFHIKAIEMLRKYFGIILRSSIAEDMSALSQKKQSHCLTEPRLKRLAQSYSKVVKNIDMSGLDDIKKEIEAYTVDEDISLFPNMEYKDYWVKVGELREGGGCEWRRYDVLPKFALALGVKLFSNSEVERAFSQMNYVTQNKQRNLMSHSMLNNFLHVKSSIESSKNKDDCEKCSRPSAQHCHCNTVDISELKPSCSKARRKYSEAQGKKKGGFRSYCRDFESKEG